MIVSCRPMGTFDFSNPLNKPAPRHAQSPSEAASQSPSPHADEAPGSPEAASDGRRWPRWTPTKAQWCLILIGWLVFGFVVMGLYSSLPRPVYETLIVVSNVMLWTTLVIIFIPKQISIPHLPAPSWVKRLPLRRPDGAEMAFAGVLAVTGWAVTSFLGGFVRWFLDEYKTPGPIVAVQVFIWLVLAGVMAVFLRRKTSSLAAKTIRGVKIAGKWGVRMIMGGGASLLASLGAGRLSGLSEQEMDENYRRAWNEAADRLVEESDDPLVKAIWAIRNRYRSNYSTAGGPTMPSEEARLREAAAAYEWQRRQAEAAQERLRQEAARAAAAQEMAKKFGLDYYSILGVEPSATDEEIKTAYRAAVRANHPDRNGGDPTAAARFRLIQAAYETLGDPQRRREYDELLLKAAL